MSENRDRQDQERADECALQPEREGTAEPSAVKQFTERGTRSSCECEGRQAVKRENRAADSRRAWQERRAHHQHHYPDKRESCRHVRQPPTDAGLEQRGPEPAGGGDGHQRERHDERHPHPGGSRCVAWDGWWGRVEQLTHSLALQG